MPYATPLPGHIPTSVAPVQNRFGRRAFFSRKAARGAPRGLADNRALREFQFVMTSQQTAVNQQPDYWQTNLVSSVFYNEQGDELAALSADVGSIQ